MEDQKVDNHLNDFYVVAHFPSFNNMKDCGYARISELEPFDNQNIAHIYNYDCLFKRKNIQKLLSDVQKKSRKPKDEKLCAYHLNIQKVKSCGICLYPKMTLLKLDLTFP